MRLHMEKTRDKVYNRRREAAIKAVFNTFGPKDIEVTGNFTDGISVKFAPGMGPEGVTDFMNAMASPVDMEGRPMEPLIKGVSLQKGDFETLVKDPLEVRVLEEAMADKIVDFNLLPVEQVLSELQTAREALWTPGEQLSEAEEELAYRNICRLQGEVMGEPISESLPQETEEEKIERELKEMNFAEARAQQHGYGY